MSGFSVAGGGSLEVDTAPMLAAAAALDHLSEDLRALLVGLVSLPPPVPLAVAAAEDRARAALVLADRAAAGLRTAGLRYGAAEDVVGHAVQGAAAAGAALAGATLRALLPVAPGLAAGLLAGGAAVVAGGLLVAAGEELVTLGTAAPQLDPRVLAVARLAIASADDAARGFLGIEGPGDLLADDPTAPAGSQAIAGLAAAVLPASAGPVVVHRVFRPLPAPAPSSLGELADRVPPSAQAEPQVRVERYDDARGRRWIVYITGTVTFEPDGGVEPFDMRSNLQGVADAPSSSEEAVRAAMRDAGVRPDEPVLLVGHSQGALDAVRIAERGDQRLAGVVTLGGPTGQVPLSADVPVLAVEHEEDPVPVLGGAVAAGAAGRERIVVRRRLYSRADPPPVSGVPSHALERYAETLHEIDRSPEPRLAAFRRRLAPFLDGRTGAATLYRAERAATPRPRGRPAAAARAR